MLDIQVSSTFLLTLTLEKSHSYKYDNLIKNGSYKLLKIKKIFCCYLGNIDLIEINRLLIFFQKLRFYPSNSISSQYRRSH